MRARATNVIHRAVPGLKLTQSGTSRLALLARQHLDVKQMNHKPQGGCEIVRSTIALGVVLVTLAGCVISPTSYAEVAQPQPDPAQPKMERFTLTETLPAGAPIKIDNPYGNVGLRFGGYANRVEVQAVRQKPPSAKLIAVEPRMEEGRWVLAPRLPADTLIAAGQRLDIVVFIPNAHPVVVLTERGAVDARGLHSDLTIRSTAGDLAIRGTQGAVTAQTGSGGIEIALGQAPAGSVQKLSTTTGNIIVGVDDGLNADVALSTSGVFATEYSLQVQHLQGQEPNKQASATVGTAAARVELSSARGEIRLLRRASYTPAVAVGVGEKTIEGEKDMNRAQAP